MHSSVQFALIRAMLLACLLAGAQRALAFGDGPMQTPLRIYSRQPILDEFGNLLSGSANSPGDSIQILMTQDGNRYPPMLNGSPSAGTTLISDPDTGIGMGTDPSLQSPGFFSIGLANEERPAEGTKLYVRVFNDPSPSNASFYTDSQVFTVNGNDRFIAVFGPMTNAVDGGDDDSDGLINSWEVSYGIYPALAHDTDHDGMNDLGEHRAGTNPADSQSRLAVYTAQTRDGEHLLLKWTSVPGKKYQIECSQDDLGSDMQFDATGPVITATGGMSEYELPCGANIPQCVYRIRLVD